jgi:O-methyltransferase
VLASADIGEDAVVLKNLRRNLKHRLKPGRAEEPRLPAIPADLDEEAAAIIRDVTPYTMTSPERVFALIQAVRYVVVARVEGAIVECGVWRGGSVMAAARVLKQAGAARDLHLFDTFEGMTRPTDADVDHAGVPATIEFERTQTGDDASDWCRATLEETRANLLGTGYDSARIHLVKGRVEETIPARAPERIALLRLDTDWYESTRHELVHLYPRLARGGVLIIDDYDHWKGSRKATDEYFAGLQQPVLLSRIDATGRIAVKTT